MNRALSFPNNQMSDDIGHEDDYEPPAEEEESQSDAADKKGSRKGKKAETKLGKGGKGSAGGAELDTHLTWLFNTIESGIKNGKAGEGGGSSSKKGGVGIGGKKSSGSKRRGKGKGKKMNGSKSKGAEGDGRKQDKYLDTSMMDNPLANQIGPTAEGLEDGTGQEMVGGGSANSIVEPDGENSSVAMANEPIGEEGEGQGEMGMMAADE